MTKELLQQALVNVHDAILRGNSDGELLVMIDDALRDAKAQQEQPTQEPLKWYDGEPPFPQNQEPFIAQTTYGDRVVLRVLSKEYSYDYITADGAYLKAESVKRWMQFPDCQFLPPESAPTQPAIPQDCDVRNILIAVVPGDGSGEEVYAKNVNDVKNLLTKMSMELDALENNTPTQPAQETCWCDQNNIGEPGVSCGDCPTRDYKQPALTYEDLETCREVAGKTFRHHKSSIRGQQLSEWDDWEWHLAKAIEAHCRGGAK